MIIPEDTQPSPKTSQLDSAQSPSQPASETPLQAPEQFQPPPAYYPSEAGSSYQAGAGPDQPLYYGLPPPAPPPVETARARFFKAFVVAILVWTLFLALTGSVAELGRQVGSEAKERKDAGTAWPHHEDGKILHCVKGPLGWSYASHDPTLTFELERTSQVLYLLARGLQATGNVMVVQDDSISAQDTVYVDIAAHGFATRYLHALSVCSLERAPGEQGVGIFTPTRWRSDNKLPALDFEITVRLPKLSSRDPLEIAALETVVPNFGHRLGDLMNTVSFGSLSLEASNAPVSCYSVRANQTTIKTSNAYIRGQFEAHGPLALYTSNADIEGTVSAYNAPGANSPTPVVLKTSNAQINVAVSLLSTAGTGGSFTVNARTSNARIALDVSALPVDATLSLSTTTSNNATVVNVPATYEGVFKIRTSLGPARAVRRRTVDPSGRGRSVSWVEAGSAAVRDGRVEWVEEHLGAIPSTLADSSIVVRTSNGPATLYL